MTRLPVEVTNFLSWAVPPEVWESPSMGTWSTGSVTYNLYLSLFNYHFVIPFSFIFHLKKNNPSSQTLTRVVCVGKKIHPLL